ncbi:MAG: energy-converting hydrogenase subunit [Methanofollis sp.]|nr:energy-converting hydrogenase subunit [Methanofollis sp.]
MIISRISRILAGYENLSLLYAVLVIAGIVIGFTSIPGIVYHGDDLYPKTIDRSSALDPYDRGGEPFGNTSVAAQYPENSPYLGYVTAYLTPFSQFLADTTSHLGTTIVSHPGGIIDEILYNTRGLDTVVETSILFTAFAIASFLFRRREG